MKPLVALACMALGTTGIATAGYLAINPNAFLSPTSRVHRQIEASKPNRISQPHTFAVASPQLIEIAPIRITGRASHLAKPTVANSALSVCSDWRTLGPAATQSASATGEHQVKLLCPNGANAQETFLAHAQR